VSVWTIERIGEQLKLTYTHEPLAANPLVQPCGATDARSASELEGWVFAQAEPWDIIETPHGRFVRQREPSDPVPIAEAPITAAANA
jgi:hypothetical protein